MPKQLNRCKCPFCRACMKYELDEQGYTVVEHKEPHCQKLIELGPTKKFLKQATAKVLDDTESLVRSRGGN